MRTYCPACLDVWAIDRAIIANSSWKNLPLNASMHIACGRALEKIHASREPVRPRWAA